MKTMKILLTILCMVFSFMSGAQQWVSDITAIRYASSDNYNSRYTSTIEYNHQLQKDGSFRIYTIQEGDTQVVGKFTYHNDILVDSGIINTPRIKLSAFFVEQDQDSRNVFIPEIGEYVVPEGQFVRSYHYGDVVHAYSQEQYVNGYKQGRAVYYDNHGYYDHTCFFNFNKDILQGQFFVLRNSNDTAILGNYNKGVKEGWWIAHNMYGRIVKKYYSSGKYIRMEEYDSNGILRAKETWNADSGFYYCSYYPDGKLQRSIMKDVNEERHGQEMQFYKNGAKKYSANYVHGKQQGLEEQWNEDGVCASRVHYNNNMIEGKYEKYYSNGELHILCYYHLDKLDGPYKEWDANGKLIAHLIFSRGRNTETLVDDRNKEKVAGTGPTDIASGVGGPGPEVDLFESYPGLKTSAKIGYTKNVYTAQVMQWVKTGTLQAIISWNKYYASLKKKDIKKWNNISQIEVCLFMQDGEIKSISLDNIPEKYQQELKDLFLKSCQEKWSLTLSYFKGEVKIIIPCNVSK